MPEQFPYPDPGWSTGPIRKAKLPPRQGPTQQDWMGIEGERKRKETKVSFDFSKLNDAELQQHHESLMTELERRQKGNANSP